MNVEATVMLARTARVREEGIVVISADVPDAVDDRDGETVEDWLTEYALSQVLAGAIDVEWHEVESWDQETTATGGEPCTQI